MIDDFEYYARSRSEAEDALLAWERAAAHFELLLNIDKTFIKELPYEFQFTWAITLSQYRFDISASARLRDDVINYFSLVFDLASAHRGDAIVSYAISRPIMQQLAANEWARALILDLLIPAMLSEPSTMPYALDLAQIAIAAGAVLNRPAFQNALNEIAHFHARLEHGYEVAWSLYLMHQLHLKLEPETAAEISRINDNMSLILLRQLITRGLLEAAAPDMSTAEGRVVEPDVFRDSDWLLAYEFAAQGWGSDVEIRKDPYLSDCLSAGVKFLDFAPAPAVVPPGPPSTAFEPDKSSGQHPSNAERPFRSGLLAALLPLVTSDD